MLPRDHHDGRRADDAEALAYGDEHDFRRRFSGVLLSMYRALHAAASVGPPVPNVGQLDRPQHGLDKPDSAVGEVVNEVGSSGPEVGDEDGDEAGGLAL